MHGIWHGVPSGLVNISAKDEGGCAAPIRRVMSIPSERMIVVTRIRLRMRFMVKE
jgi:hypothetical protein